MKKVAPAWHTFQIKDKLPNIGKMGLVLASVAELDYEQPMYPSIHTLTCASSR